MYQYELEQIEWSNIWRDDSTEKDKPRMLLIGDSITQGYGHNVYNMLDKKWALTRYSTSKGIDNPYLLEEIFMVAKQENYAYDFVHFNNGIHADYISDEDFAVFYQQAVWALRDKFPNSKIAIATSTTLCKKENGVMVLSEKNDMVVRRNAIMRRIAEGSGIKVNDLYEVAARDNNYHCEDCVHFTAEGYEVLGRQVADFLLSL